LECQMVMITFLGSLSQSGTTYTDLRWRCAPSCIAKYDAWMSCTGISGAQSSWARSENGVWQTPVTEVRKILFVRTEEKTAYGECRGTQKPVVLWVRLGFGFYSLFCIAWGQRCRSGADRSFLRRRGVSLTTYHLLGPPAVHPSVPPSHLLVTVSVSPKGWVPEGSRLTSLSLGKGDSSTLPYILLGCSGPDWEQTWDWRWSQGWGDPRIRAEWAAPTYHFLGPFLGVWTIPISLQPGSLFHTGPTHHKEVLGPSCGDNTECCLFWNPPHLQDLKLRSHRSPVTPSLRGQFLPEPATAHLVTTGIVRRWSGSLQDSFFFLVSTGVELRALSLLSRCSPTKTCPSPLHVRYFSNTYALHIAGITGVPHVQLLLVEMGFCERFAKASL
jgi:hypothetical protein